ncbi:MAG: hypothetical protein H7095_02455 [Pseudopedobacter sp.]|nr:hypothetical protein [Deinococcales bacterium]
MILHLSHIFLTDVLTFMPFSFAQPSLSLSLESYPNSYKVWIIRSSLRRSLSSATPPA